MTKTLLGLGIVLSLGLAGCRTEEWITEIHRPAVMEIDTTSDALLAWLNRNGYPGALLTGRRTEDCAPDDLAGYGVILKVMNQDKPKAASAVVCEDATGQYRVMPDRPS